MILLSIFGTVLSKYQIRSCVCNLSVNLRACQTKHKTCKTCGCERGFCVYTLRLCWCHNKTLGGQDISKYGVIRKCLSLARHSRKMFIMKAFCSQWRKAIAAWRALQKKTRQQRNKLYSGLIFCFFSKTKIVLQLFSDLMNVYPKLQMFGPIARGGDYIMGGSDISSLLYNCHFWAV